ncbi:MAG TPA: pantoate--beta-alanine ligase [Solirubrobacteraceae bacterium]|nr:pantoate--beta-alanine ligase [Solirubrobacteraceae bacterium]
MRTVRTIAILRETLAEPRRAGHRIGLVPTMGAFHEGHLSLMRRAREECDVLVVSLFVNPTQFDRPDDLSRYPREEAADASIASELGVDYLFAPAVSEMYPQGFATTVSVRGMTETLEGAHRGRGHFDGVATVVTKLLNIVGPDVAYFGQKDAQQALVIARLVRDLDLPVRIEVCPTVREPDGLALSSRNALLSAGERPRALALSRALAGAQAAVALGERDAAKVAGAARTQMTSDGVEPEYFELVSPDTLAPVRMIDGDVLAVVAAHVGTTRLIDNQILVTNGRREWST